MAHHGHQTDVHDLRPEVAHYMHADQRQIVLTKEQLQKAILVANDPTAGIFPIVSSAYDVGDPFFLRDSSVSPTMLTSGIV